MISDEDFFFCFPIQRLPFSVGFIGCMVGTIYVSMMLHSYFLSVIFSVLQVCPSPMQWFTWLYLFKLCYTAENTCFSAFRVLFPITARLEHAAYLNNESTLSWFKGDSHLFYFFHIYFFCLLYLLTFEQYNVMICCCLYGLQKCNTSSFSCIFHFLDSLSSLYLTQVLALAYYTISYFPGGSSGLKFISSSLLSSVTSCFGR